DDRHGAHLEVAVAAGAGAHAVVPLEHGAPAQRLLPRLLGGRALVGVDDVQPAVGEVLLQPLAGDGAPLRRVLGDRAGGRGYPHQLGLRLDQRAVALLAAAQLLLYLAALGHVEPDQGDGAQLARLVVDRRERHRPVTVGALERAHPPPPLGDGALALDDGLDALRDGLAQVGGEHFHGGAPDQPLGGHVDEVAEDVVDPLDAALDVEEGEGELRLGQQAFEQGGVRDVHIRLPGTGNGGLGAHGPYLRRVPGSPTRHISIVVYRRDAAPGDRILQYIIGDGHARTEAPAAIRSTHPVKVAPRCAARSGYSAFAACLKALTFARLSASTTSATDR